MKRENKPTNSSEMFDALVRSALDFLRRSAEELEKTPNYSAIDFCTAIELFLKARLLAEHWTLIYLDLTKAIREKKATLSKIRQGDIVSVGIKEAIPRLRELLNLNISPEAERAFDSISKHRNKLIHFFHPSFSQNPSASALEIAGVVAEQCRGWYYLYPLLKDSWQSIFAPYLSDIEKVHSLMLEKRAFLQVRFEARSKDIELGKARGELFRNCPSCGFEAKRIAMIAGPVFSTGCLVCEAGGLRLAINCPGCGTTLVGHLYMICHCCSRPITLEDVLHAYPAHNDRVGIESGLAYCGSLNCFEEGGWQGDVGLDETLESVVLFGDKWICLGCFGVEKNTWYCSCGRRISGEFNGPLCFICELQDEDVWPPMFGGIM